ncbi:hypothetical protein [Lederbergia graminis]|uniref:Uncharacterized protein n=1 Tax=Lederbergia graminis TaxID=735518 RepID=A0ABW0LQ05_9BACI
MRSLFKKVTSSMWIDVFIPTIDSYSKSMQLVAGASLGGLAAILQSAGIFTGVGYIFSMMSTAPIVLACLLSMNIGVMTYFLTILLVAILQPTELFIFIFTTGLLGLSLGFSMKYLRRNILIIAFSAITLTIGISILLYGMKFAILGPSITTKISSTVILGTFAFSLLYSWIWKKVCISIFRFIHTFLNHKK